MWQWKSQTRARGEVSDVRSKPRARKLGGEELIWIVGLEAKDDVAIGLHLEDVAAHRRFGEGDVVGEGALLVLRAGDGLECVTVQMEGVLARIFAVEDDLDDLVFLQHQSIGVGPIDAGVSGHIAGGEY